MTEGKEASRNMQSGAPPDAPSTAMRTHEAEQDEGQQVQDKRGLDGGRRKRIEGSELDGSGIPRKMLKKSFKENESKGDGMEHYESNGDGMEHYKSILCELLSRNETSSYNAVVKEVQGTDIHKGKESYVGDRTFPLFAKQISGLSKDDKEKIKCVIHEVVAFLDNDVDEVNRDIRAMEESGQTCQEAVKKLSAGFLGKLGKMAQGVDELLNTAASKCRVMSTEEKIELGNRIHKLPQEALDRVVEIITARKTASQSCNKITIKLAELDNATLWRLYYHVEYVLRESKT